MDAEGNFPESQDASHVENNKHYGCSLAMSLLMLFLGAIAILFSFVFITSNSSTFPTLLVAGISLIASGVCLLCADKKRRKHMQRKNNRSMIMVPVVNGDDSQRNMPGVSGPGIPLAQNTLNTSLCNDYQQTLQIVNETVNSNGIGSTYTTNRHFNCGSMPITVPNIISSMYEDPPPSYESVIASMKGKKTVE